MVIRNMHIISVRDHWIAWQSIGFTKVKLIQRKLDKVVTIILNIFDIDK